MSREDAIKRLNDEGLAVSEYAINLLIQTAKLKEMCDGGDTA